jgi:hypothetical protein
VKTKTKTKQRPGGGRHLPPIRQFPPNDQVIGRSEAARILGCSKSTAWRMQKRGELTAALKVGKASWFDRATVLQLALKRKKEEREREAVAHRPASPAAPSPRRSKQDPLPARPARKPLERVPDSWLADDFVPAEDLPSDADKDSPPPPVEKKKLADVPAEWLADDFRTLDELEDDNDEGPEPPEKPKG